MKFSVSQLYFIVFLFIYLFIYIFIYLFRAANFMYNINKIHRSFFPTALPHRLIFLFLALPFLSLPNSLPCLFPCPAYFLALPIFFPCLFPFPAYFLDRPMPTSLCLCLLPIHIVIPFLYIYKKKCILQG